MHVGLPADQIGPLEGARYSPKKCPSKKRETMTAYKWRLIHFCSQVALHQANVRWVKELALPMQSVQLDWNVRMKTALEDTNVATVSVRNDFAANIPDN